LADLLIFNSGITVQGKDIALFSSKLVYTLCERFIDGVEANKKNVYSASIPWKNRRSHFLPKNNRHYI